jgi:hypothetical protein
VLGADHRPAVTVVRHRPGGLVERSVVRDFVDRWLVQLVVGLGVLAIAAIGVSVAAIAVAKSADDEVAQARAELASSQEDVERLRAAVRDFVGEAQSLQDQLSAAGPAMSQALAEAISGLETFGTSTIELDVAVSDTVSVNSAFEIDRTLQVPIQLTLPVDETIETTIVVDTPVGVDIPVDVRVPLQLELPVEVTVSIPIKETIPVTAEVPIELDVPVKLDVASTELGDLTASLASGLGSLETLLAALEGS